MKYLLLTFLDNFGFGALFLALPGLETSLEDDDECYLTVTRLDQTISKLIC